jgi:hypothetical protein
MLKQPIQWHHSVSIKEKGMLIACDAEQEWILPWWWHYYAMHNSLPVTFVDIGMSEEAKQWCRQRGELVSLHVHFPYWKEKDEMDPQAIALWQQVFGEGFWSSRRAWFSKPFALLLTPYRQTLWVDLDCQVQGDLSTLFQEEIAVGLCPWASGAEMRWRDQGFFADEVIYNGGVILYRHKDPLIVHWAQGALTRAEQFTTDDHLLSRIIHEKSYPIYSLPRTYNAHYAIDTLADARIIHYCGPGGKELIWLERSLRT